VPSREFEGFIPADRHVFVRSRVVAHGLRQTSGRLERIIGPPRQLLHRVRREKIALHQLARHFPGRVLDAIFADVHAQSLAVIRPCASRAVVSAVLMIHLKDGTSAVDQLALLDQDLRDANGCTPPGSGMVIILLREVASSVGAEANR
jgi:hypothetical protein